MLRNPSIPDADTTKPKRSALDSEPWPRTLRPPNNEVRNPKSPFLATKALNPNTEIQSSPNNPKQSRGIVGERGVDKQPDRTKQLRLQLPGPC